MTTNIYILAGGVGSRIECLDIPKALLPVPCCSNKTIEPLLDRTIRQWGEGNIILCLGYKSEMFVGYPNKKMITYKPNSPVGVAMAISQCMACDLIDRYVFLFGDVVWTNHAIKLVKNHYVDRPLIFFAENEAKIHCISISSQVKYSWEPLIDSSDAKELSKAKDILAMLDDSYIFPIKDQTDDIDTDRGYYKIIQEMYRFNL